MKKKIIQILNKPIIKNVTIMVFGAAGAQLITVGLSPLITRLYGPEAFGILGAFTSLINIIVPIAALTYPLAIVLPRHDESAKAIVKLSLIITTLMSLLSFIVIFFFNSQLVNLFSFQSNSYLLYLIPVVIIFAGLMQVSEQWLIRMKQFAINARVNVIQSFIVNFGKVGIGYFYPIASVLIILTVLANGLKAGLMFFFMKKPIIKKNKNKNKKTVNIKLIAKKYYDFPLYRMPEAFLSALSQSIPVLMLTAFFGPASAGFYTIGRTVLFMPSALIGKAVEDVFYPRIAEAIIKKENITSIIKRATYALIGIGIVPFGIVILFGPILFGFVFGSEWEVAGEYARWIALWSFSSFIIRPSVKSLAVLNSQRLHLIYTFIMLITRTILLALGYYVFSSDLIAIALFGISGGIFNFMLIIITLNLSRKKRYSIIR